MQESILLAGVCGPKTSSVIPAKKNPNSGISIAMFRHKEAVSSPSATFFYSQQDDFMKLFKLIILIESPIRHYN